MPTLESSLPTLVADTPHSGPSTTSYTCVVRADEGVFCQGPGEASLVKFTGEHTANSVTVSRATVDANSGPPPHVHGNEDEIFLIHSGLFEFFTNGQLLEARAGDVVYAPRGEAHRFRGLDGSEPNVFSILATPSGFEQFMARWVLLFETGAPDMEAAVRLCGEYNIALFPSDDAAPQALTSQAKFVQAPQVTAHELPLSEVSLQAVVLLSATDTEGRCGMVRLSGGQDAHLASRTLTNTDQLFIVEAGQAEVEWDGQTVQVTAGDNIWVPRGVAHSLRTTSEATQIAVFLTPGGQEETFA